MKSMQETFQFGSYRFDVTMINEMIKLRTINYSDSITNIENYAKHVLALDRDRPGQRPYSLLMRINYDHLDTITDRRLEDPIIVMQTKMGAMVIDGNHRVAKAYMKGINELPSFVIDLEQGDKLNMNSSNSYYLKEKHNAQKKLHRLPRILGGSEITRA